MPMKHNYKKTKPTNEFVFRPDRLKVLADHLQNGSLYFPGKIEMAEIQLAEPGFETEPLVLITYPIYELIYLFPAEWGIDEDGFPRWIEDSDMNPVASTIKFFGINIGMLRHLFIPHRQNVRCFGGKRLSSNASSKEIAHNIYELIKEAESFRLSKLFPINLN